MNNYLNEENTIVLNADSTPINPMNWRIMKKFIKLKTKSNLEIL